jgi:hypothetical protein
MYAHWRQYPPVHVTAALFAGSGSRSKQTAAPTETAANDANDETLAYVQAMPIMKAQLPGK